MWIDIIIKIIAFLLTSVTIIIIYFVIKYKKNINIKAGK